MSAYDTTVELITPEKAKVLLAKNRSNRTVRTGSVAKYAADMSEGRWRDTPHGIIIGAGGVLIDGQHRLHAVIKSGASVMMHVHRGIDTSPMDCMVDSGQSRSVSDITNINRNILAIFNTIFFINASRMPSVDESVHGCAVLEELWPSGFHSIRSSRGQCKHVGTAYYSAAALIAAYHYDDMEYVCKAWRSMRSMDFSGGMPQYAQSFMRCAIDGKLEKLSRNGRMQALIAALDPSKAGHKLFRPNNIDPSLPKQLSQDLFIAMTKQEANQ